MQIAIDEIEIGERFRTDYGDLEQLSYDINKNGLITPIAVGIQANVNMGTEKSDKKYILLAGGRRTAAMKHLGWTHTTVRLYEQNLSRLDMRSIELAENLMREDMGFVEEAQLKKEINDLQMAIHGVKVGKSPNSPGWSKKQTADLLGVSDATVIEDIKLAEAIEQFPELELDKCKNKTEAKKRLKSVTKMVEINQGSAAYQKSMGGDKNFKALSNQYIVGDCFETFASLSPNTLDLIEIDPPYGIDLHKVKKDNECIGYNEIPADEYKDFMARVLAESYRTMREGSWLLVWFAADPWFDTIATLIEEAGFKMNRIPMVWVKPQGQTAQPETFLGNSYEMCFYARKGKAKLNKPGRSNIFSYNPVPHTRKYHPTQRPFELLTEMLSTFAKPGANIFVPFLGSGNTIIAGHAEQMTVVGTDLTAYFKDGYIVQLEEVLK